MRQTPRSWIFSAVLPVLLIIAVLLMALYFRNGGASLETGTAVEQEVAGEGSILEGVLAGGRETGNRSAPYFQVAAGAGASVPGSDAALVAGETSAGGMALAPGDGEQAGGEVAREPVAILKIGGREVRALPDADGIYPREVLREGERAEVAVSYPEARPGDLVVVQANDGGRLADGKVAMLAEVDAHGQVRFPFSRTPEGGIYTITLRRGTEERHVQFRGE